MSQQCFRNVSVKAFPFQNLFVNSACMYIIHLGNWIGVPITIFEKHSYDHGLRTPREEIAFTARPKIHSHSQIFRYGQSIFCLPHRPNFSDIFDLCLHWVSVVCGRNNEEKVFRNPLLIMLFFLVKTFNAFSLELQRQTGRKFTKKIFLLYHYTVACH